MTESIERTELVSVRRQDDGTVVVSPSAADEPMPFPSAIHAAKLPVNGGILTVDIRTPDRFPIAVLDDVYWAQTWLEGVYGAEVAEYIGNFFEAPPYPAPNNVQAHSEYLTSVVEQLGVGFWLHRWWPSDWVGIPRIDEDFLEIEVSGLAWMAEALMEDLEPIRHLVTPHAHLIASQLAPLLATSGQVAGREAAILTEALRAVVDLADEETPGYDECVELLRSPELEAIFESTAPTPSPTVGWLRNAIARLKEMAQLALAGQVALEAARGSDDAPEEERGPIVQEGAVDWLQVPPRVVSTKYPLSNLEWWVETSPTGPATLHVSVAAASDYDDNRGDVLYVRAYDDSDTPTLFALTYVRREPDGEPRFEGSGELLGGSGANLRVDVFSSDFALKPRLSPEGAARAQADRDEVIKWIRARRNQPISQLLAEQAAWAADSN
jgi:hypothetical protein